LGSIGGSVSWSQDHGFDIPLETLLRPMPRLLYLDDQAMALTDPLGSGQKQAILDARP
jgi:hypothetical protein